VSVAVLGAGSWGTAIAVILARAGHRTLLWSRRPDAASAMKSTRENVAYLPGVPLPDGLDVTADLDRVAEEPLAILAVPTRAQRELAKVRARLGGARAVLCAAKGYEPETRKRMSVVLREELGAGIGVAVLAGPSHAEEVAREIPTTVVVAAEDEATALVFQDLMMTPTFRVYTNGDVLGVETAASLKNVIAIAAGICDGLGFGDNTKGALLTRGLAEIARLGVALGARPETFYGLAGIGDLVTTCISHHSRNRRIGEVVAEGLDVAGATAKTVIVAEGVSSTRSALKFAEDVGVELPITEKVCEVLFEGKDPRTALGELMERDAKAEVR
jgi:glycerol-3-phosphate dehydrogenase (NAD(P)+)